MSKLNQMEQPIQKITPKLISIVIPLFNEKDSLPHLKKRLIQLARNIECALEFVLVNDGSTDKTEELLKMWSLEDEQVKVINLSRNFGHQAAITAGLDFAVGEAIVLMDGDLQDPPEVIIEMLEQFKLGYEVILGRRTKRHGENFFKLLTAKGFYWLLQKIIRGPKQINQGDFCMFSSNVGRSIRSMREHHRFIRGMVSWAGFPTAFIEFERSGRDRGKTKFTFKKMISFAWDAIFSFSILPLRLASILGLLVVVFGFLYGITGIYDSYKGTTVRGWTSIIVLTCTLSGTILLCLGIIGEYVGRIYEESKKRPLYLVRETFNLNPPKNNRQLDFPIYFANY